MIKSGDITYNHDAVVQGLRNARVFVEYTDFTVGKFVFNPHKDFRICIPPTKDAMASLFAVMRTHSPEIQIGSMLTLRYNLAVPPDQRKLIEWSRRKVLPISGNKDLAKYISANEYVLTKTYA
jgi:hypothetical protein